MIDLLIEGRRLMGAAVVDLDTGDDIAEIRDVIFEPGAGRLVGFTLNKPAHGWRGWLKGRATEVLDVANVAAVGPNAVMVRRRDDPLSSSEDAPQVSGANPAKDEVVDDRVVTESGRALGTLVDVVISLGLEPRVVGYRVAGESDGDLYVPREAQTAVSGRALIVPDDIERVAGRDLATLAATLAAPTEEPSR